FLWICARRVRKESCGSSPRFWGGGLRGEPSRRALRRLRRSPGGSRRRRRRARAGCRGWFTRLRLERDRAAVARRRGRRRLRGGRCRLRGGRRRGRARRGRRLAAHGLAARVGCIRTNDHGANLLGLARCIRALPRCDRRRQHNARGGLGCQVLERDRLFLLRNDLFLVGVCRPILRDVDRLRIAGAGGDDLCRRGLVSRGKRRRRGGAGIAEIAAIGIGAGGAEHGATDQRERGDEAAATPRARRVVIHRVFMRIERDVVVLVVVLGLCLLSVVLAVVRPVVVVILGLLVRPDVQLVIETAVGLGLCGRRIVIPARFLARLLARAMAGALAGALGPAVLRAADGELRFTRRSALPVVRRGRRRIMRLLLPLARITSPEVGEWIALPEQTGKLGQRIAGTCLLAGPPRLGPAAVW